MSFVASSGTFSTDDTMSVLMVRVILGSLLLLALTIGAVRRSRQNDLRCSWVEVRGEVIDTTRDQPTVRYRTAIGETITMRRRVGWKIVTPVVGKEVPVWYDPADPKRFQVQVLGIDRRGSLSFIVAGLVGVLILLFIVPGVFRVI